MTRLSHRNIDVLLSCALCLIALSAHAAELDWPDVELVAVVGGLVKPTHVTHAGDGSGRLFICEQPGRVRILQNGVIAPVPFLDITSRVLSDSESGLLSIAFPPGFSSKSYFYVNYSRPGRTSVLSRFFLSTNRDVANPASERVLLVNEQPSADHCGGQLAFGPDGFLYISRGEGGHAINAQTPSNLLGKILRIDVESVTTGYRIPDDNPFRTNAAYRPEIWAMGLRNPWRFSFDRLTGDLYIADVGEVSREEVNFQPTLSIGGQNYGWPYREGTLVRSNSNQHFELPAFEYPRFANGENIGSAVIGGFVFRGAPTGRLGGFYFHCDYFSRRIWAAKRVGTNWATELVGTCPSGMTSWGEDEEGNLYAVAEQRFASPAALYQLRDSGRTAKPVFRPPGTLLWDDVITIHSLTPDSVIHYTTDGRDPIDTDPIIDSGSTLAVTNGMTVKAVALHSSLQPSLVQTTRYNVRVTPPEFNPAHFITNGTLVTISTQTPGATIRYAFELNPDWSSALVYTGAILMNSGTWLSAQATRAGFETAYSSVQFELTPVATPYFDPPPRPLIEPTLITITSDTPGATIHYTLDVSTPTTDSPVYSTPILINPGTFVQAMAWHKDFAANSSSAWYPKVETPAFEPPVAEITNGTLIAIVLRWSSVPGRTYQIQYTSALPATMWTNLGSTRPGNGSTDSITDTVLPGEPQRFYRILLVP